MSFDEFWGKGYIYFEPNKDAYKFVRHADFRADPVANKLATESGKIQIFSEKFASFGLDDFKGHPTWFEPAEWLGDAELTKKHPLHLLSPHPKYRIHSQLDNSFVRKAYKVANREPVLINDEDAKAYGIKDGDVVEIYNDRGAILCGAVVSKHIMKGVISVEEGAWYDSEDAKADKPRCNAGHVNILTTSVPTSKMAQATSVNTCLAAIKKVDVKPYAGVKAPVVKGA